MGGEKGTLAGGRGEGDNWLVGGEKGTLAGEKGLWLVVGKRTSGLVGWEKGTLAGGWERGPACGGEKGTPLVGGGGMGLWLVAGELWPGGGEKVTLGWWVGEGALVVGGEKGTLAGRGTLAVWGEGTLAGGGERRGLWLVGGEKGTLAGGWG